MGHDRPMAWNQVTTAANKAIQALASSRPLATPSIRIKTKLSAASRVSSIAILNRRPSTVRTESVHCCSACANAGSASWVEAAPVSAGASVRSVIVAGLAAGDIRQQYAGAERNAQRCHGVLLHE